MGLNKAEGKIYFYLAKGGPKKAKDIEKKLNMSKQQLYPLMKSLKKKAIVNATLDRPATFSAIPVEKVLDILTKAKVEEAKLLQKNKARLLSDWKSVSQETNQDVSSNFTVIKGKNYLFSKIQQMINETKNSFSIISNISDLFRLEQFGAFDSINKHSTKFDAKFRIITDITNYNLKSIKSIIENINPKLELKARNPDIGISLFPRLALKDNEEILYFISSKPQKTNKYEYEAILTDCNSFVAPFSRLFDDLWNNSTDIDQKIRDIETGQVSPRTIIINDSQIAKTKYNNALKNAENEILFVTSPKSLNIFAKELIKFQDWLNQGISLKIMAPITGENIESARKLSSCCKIKHVPATYIDTTIIDGKHLFQFTEADNSIFYTNDPERINKSLNMLQNIWKNSCYPSAISMDSLFNEPTSDYEFKFHHKVQDIEIFNQQSKFTENDVLKKIINTNAELDFDSSLKKFFACCSVGFALVHPPASFKLPDVLICALHIDKKSSFGPEDALMVYLWLKTPMGFKYVPFTVVGDNPKGSVGWKTQMRGTPAEKNIRLINKDQIQIQVYGNTFFAEWKTPITLIPNKFTLPPAAFLLEAYGKIRTHSYSTSSPAGVKSNWIMNAFEAFVTFMHQESKYTGPGTDGLFIRDAYIETILP